jgi:8-oxo-dGTP pyrophosphatase MutT (NUDIX family)
VYELPEEWTPAPGMMPDEPPVSPTVPRDAATVVLLREGARGLEAFLLRRVTDMAFAGGMTVFPGGGVDHRDAQADIAWAGPPPAQWAERFDCSESLARALVCAAVRETFEEAGVLLAGSGPNESIADTAAYAGVRAALVNRETSLGEFLAEAGLVLRADLLRPWAHWITPLDQPRRYDTRFFVAELPRGQHADGATSEAEAAAWRRPADALADADEGSTRLLLPTWLTLAELTEPAGMAEVMGASRRIEAITPVAVSGEGRRRVVLPELAQPARGRG